MKSKMKTNPAECALCHRIGGKLVQRGNYLFGPKCIKEVDKAEEERGATSVAACFLCGQDFLLNPSMCDSIVCCGCCIGAGRYRSCAI